jgi:hypothetical protein
MPLIRKKKHGLSEKVFTAEAHSMKRTISLDFLDGWIQSNLTVSTLMVGVSLTLMSLVGFSDVDLMSAYDSESTVKAITWNYLTTLCSWVGFLTSGAVFGWSLVLSHCLEIHHIHPEDYNSARVWYNCYKFFLLCSRSFWVSLISRWPSARQVL